jgi:hypothetical protein
MTVFVTLDRGVRPYARSPALRMFEPAAAVRADKMQSGWSLKAKPNETFHRRLCPVSGHVGFNTRWIRLVRI